MSVSSVRRFGAPVIVVIDPLRFDAENFRFARAERMAFVVRLLRR